MKHTKFRKLKEIKKEFSGKLMPVACHPDKWWDWCMSGDDKKINRPNVYLKVIKVCVDSI